MVLLELFYAYQLMPHWQRTIRLCFPLHPDALTNVVWITQYKIAALKTLHKEEIETYHAYKLVQGVLEQYVLKEIKTKYLSNLRNQVTGQVPSKIRIMMLQLFRIYGKIHLSRSERKMTRWKAWNIKWKKASTLFIMRPKV